MANSQAKKFAATAVSKSVSKRAPGLVFELLNGTVLQSRQLGSVLVPQAWRSSIILFDPGGAHDAAKKANPKGGAADSENGVSYAWLTSAMRRTP